MNKIIIPVVLSALILASCGSSSKSDAAMSNRANGGSSYKSNSFTAGASAENSVSFDYAPSESYDYEYSEAESANAEANGAKENNTLDSGVQKEMLVYSCRMTVDVLDFQTAIDLFRNNLKEYGAFVENEQYSDGGSDNRWYYADTEKWQTYTATVRVPSSSYDDFCSGAASLGDLRSKNATVENLSREYYDLSATLEIYEAKEKRYIEMLAGIMDDEYAIAVEKELTNIQIEISKIRTRMNVIQTDVAYSYVYITINEVKEYAAEPVKTDTFLQRLWNTVSDATRSFLNFAEGLLFAFIYMFPHLVIIGVIAFFVVKGIKKSKAKKAAAKTVDTSAPAAPEKTVPEEKATEKQEVKTAEKPAEKSAETKEEKPSPEQEKTPENKPENKGKKK